MKSSLFCKYLLLCLSTDLVVKYNINDVVTRFVRRVMGLAVLPKDVVTNEAIPQLRRDSLALNDVNCDQLLEYMEATWFQRVADWVVFGSTTRTINSLEGKIVN